MISHLLRAWFRGTIIMLLVLGALAIFFLWWLGHSGESGKPLALRPATPVVTTTAPTSTYDHAGVKKGDFKDFENWWDQVRKAQEIAGDHRLDDTCKEWRDHPEATLKSSLQSNSIGQYSRAELTDLYDSHCSNGKVVK